MIKHVDKPRGTARQAVLWVGIWLLLAMGISLGLMWWAGTAQAAHCGMGLAAEDLAGNCRLNLPTPGALEAVGQAPAPTPIPEPTPTPTPTPTPAHTGWEVVPAGTYATRPLYNLTVFEKDGFLNSIGRVERWQVCESEELRKTTYSYHAVTNKAGVRGLAVCTQTEGSPAPTPTPAPSNQAIVTATWTADIFSTGGKGFDNPWDHCVGQQKNFICRTVIVFPTAGLPKDKVIASLRLKVIVPFVKAGLETTTWAVGRYDGDPKTDSDALAFARACTACGKTYITGTSLLRTTGTKTLGLTKAVADLNAAVREGRLFIVAIKSNRESDVDRFTVIGRYNLPSTAPQLIVGY